MANRRKKERRNTDRRETKRRKGKDNRNTPHIELKDLGVLDNGDGMYSFELDKETHSIFLNLAVEQIFDGTLTKKDVIRSSPEGTAKNIDDILAGVMMKAIETYALDRISLFSKIKYRLLRFMGV